MKTNMIAAQGAAIKKHRRKRVDINYLQLWSLCIIPMLLVFVFCYLPMGGVIIAFKNYKYSLLCLLSFSFNHYLPIMFPDLLSLTLNLRIELEIYSLTRSFLN